MEPERGIRRWRRALVLACLPFLALLGCSHLVGRSNAGIAALERQPSPVGPVSRGAKYAGWGLSAPLVAAAVVPAALAWATPWVDLPLAVDIASAPAIGMGYLLEGVVGFPVAAARALTRRRDASDGQTPRPQEEPVPWGFVVDHLPPARPARPAEALPSELAAYYAVSSREVDLLREEMALLARNPRAKESPIQVPLPFDRDFKADLDLYLADRKAGDPPRPLVLLTPPSRAAFAARYLARRYARLGVHAVVVVPRADFLEPDLLPARIEAKFHAAVVTARAVFLAAAGLEGVDRDRLYYVGVSAGGIFGAILLAVEPEIRRAVLVLPGGDLPRIISESEEETVLAYRRAWEARGVDRKALAQVLKRELRTDPLRLAPYIDPERVLIFLGAGDTQVPVATGLELRRALGDPETYLLAGNHDTAVLCFGFVLNRAEEFLFGS
jgi:dienelactone hydrolase